MTQQAPDRQPGAAAHATSGPALSPSAREQIERIRDRYPQPRSAILPSLWVVQHEVGHLSPEGMAEVAELLGLVPSDVEAVATFYSMYFQKPHGRHEVLVCINVSCALRGADDIVEHIAHSLGCPSGSTTADGAFTWSSTVECLGGCGGAPMMQVDHHFHENLTPAGVDAIFAGIRSSGSDGAAAAAPVSDAGVSGAMVQPGPHEKTQRRRGGKGPR
jgi:NADH-quinone oxidoreductase subunit E